MTKAVRYSYHLFGFSVASEFELPELGTPKAVNRNMDLQDHSVQITLGLVPSNLEGGHKIKNFLEFNNTECIYHVKDTARYLISAGKRIVIEPVHGASMIDIRFYLFGTIIGALLHQRKLLPLHISAIETPRGIVAFTGPSGAGKSTTAFDIHNLTGWRLLSDDVAVVNPEESATLLHCGIFRQKLWKDTVERAGLQPETLTRDTTRAEKYHIVSPGLFLAGPCDLSSLVILDVGPTAALDKLGPSQAFAEVMNTIYRPDLARLFGDIPTIMQNAARIADEVDTFRFSRPWSIDDISKSTHNLVNYFSA